MATLQRLLFVGEKGLTCLGSGSIRVGRELVVGYKITGDFGCPVFAGWDTPIKLRYGG